MVALVCDNNFLLSAITSNHTKISNDIKQVNSDGKKLHKEVLTKMNDGLKKESNARNKAIKTVLKDSTLLNDQLHKRLAILEQGPESKKPRNTPNAAQKQTKNIISNKNNDSFGWCKMVKGVSNVMKGFATAEEAQEDMMRFYAEESA